MLTAAGRTLRFLPAYSPDFTSIEQAKLKQHRRRAQARSEEALAAALSAALATISAGDARVWFHHGGYKLEDQAVGQSLRELL